MRAIIFLLCLGAFSSKTYAAGSTAFKDSFRAFVDMRRLEEQNTLLAAKSDAEPEEKRRELQRLSSKLTQARIDFHSFLDSENETLTPWEKRVLGRLEKQKQTPGSSALDEEALSYLHETYPSAHEFSALEWQAVGEFFGTDTQNAFLEATFGLKGTPPTEKSKGEKRFAVWIDTPSFPILTKQEQAHQKSERAAADRKLISFGYQVEEISVSAFIRVEDQAEDLQKSLKSRLGKGEFLLLSHGAASAVLLRTFDLYPDLLSLGGISGWMNLNGQLYGIAPESNSRKPASQKKISAADRQEFDMHQEFLRLRQERLERQAPLGAKFPVLNIVTRGAKQRTARNLRDSLVPEGKTLFLRNGSVFSGIDAALPAIISP